jgi:general secretion pathway protein A
MSDIVLEHFQLRRHPYTPEIDTEGLYHFQGFSQGLLRLEQAIHHRGPVLVVGDPGAGKTAMIRKFSGRLAASSFMVCVQLVPPGKNSIKPVIEGLLTELGESIPFHNPTQALSCLKRCLQRLYEQGRTPVLFIDDAHHLVPSGWLTLKTLMNFELDSKMPALLVFTGARQETLRMLDLNILQEVRDRFSFCYHIKGLKEPEVEKYLETRLQWAGAKHPLFPAGIAEQIGRHAQWLPRRINRLAGACLMAAATAKRSLIDQDCLDQAVSEMNFKAQREED